MRTKLVLERLKTDLNSNEPVRADGLAIEHIRPWTRNAAWRADLGPDAERDHLALLHTLGKLTLTGYNGQLFNIQFAEMRNEFARSDL